MGEAKRRQTAGVERGFAKRRWGITADHRHEARRHEMAVARYRAANAAKARGTEEGPSFDEPAESHRRDMGTVVQLVAATIGIGACFPSLGMPDLGSTRRGR